MQDLTEAEKSLLDEKDPYHIKVLCEHLEKIKRGDIKNIRLDIVRRNDWKIS